MNPRGWPESIRSATYFPECRAPSGSFFSAAFSGSASECWASPTGRSPSRRRRWSAGSSPYPPDNVFYIYHTRLWTVLHQLLALGLRAGVSELTLSLIVSGVQGMLTFQALALFVYALSRDILLAVGAAAMIFFTRSAEYGTVYPLFLLGTEHTYGVVGLSTGVLAVAMLGTGWYRAGALLLGMAPCIHPALGSWTVL